MNPIAGGVGQPVGIGIVSLDDNAGHRLVGPGLTLLSGDQVLDQGTLRVGDLADVPAQKTDLGPPDVNLDTRTRRRHSPWMIFPATVTLRWRGMSPCVTV